jgi:hypothetical protein
VKAEGRETIFGFLSLEGGGQGALVSKLLRAPSAFSMLMAR